MSYRRYGKPSGDMTALIVVIMTVVFVLYLWKG
jgi:hypothetical protein